jgi:hypothetical protein
MRRFWPSSGRFRSISDSQRQAESFWLSPAPTPNQNTDCDVIENGHGIVRSDWPLQHHPNSKISLDHIAGSKSEFLWSASHDKGQPAPNVAKIENLIDGGYRPNSPLYAYSSELAILAGIAIMDRVARSNALIDPNRGSLPFISTPAG